jgi:hypothetical protein
MGALWRRAGAAAWVPTRRSSRARCSRSSATASTSRCPARTKIVNDQRYKTTSTLKNVGDEVITFEVNSNNAKAEGGSCFGDSGGGVFLGGYVLGDAPYVNSLTCNGTGSYQRDDTPYSRAFLSTFLG